MSKYAYAQTAIRAVSYINANHTAEEAWEKASCEFFEEVRMFNESHVPERRFMVCFLKIL